MSVECATTNESDFRFTILIVICLCIWGTSFAFFTWLYDRLPLVFTAALTALMVIAGPVNMINQYIED